MLRNRGVQNTKQKQLRQKTDHAWSTGKPIFTMEQNRKCLGHLPAGALSLRIATCCDCSSNPRNDLRTEIWINPSILWSGQSENSQKSGISIAKRTTIQKICQKCGLRSKRFRASSLRKRIFHFVCSRSTELWNAYDAGFHRGFI